MMYIYQYSTKKAVSAVSGSPLRSHRAHSDEDDDSTTPSAFTGETHDAHTYHPSHNSHMTSMPGLSAGLTPPLNAVEQEHLEPTTHIVSEPTLSFTYDSQESLYDPFSTAQGAHDGVMIDDSENERECLSRFTGPLLTGSPPFNQGMEKGTKMDSGWRKRKRKAREDVQDSEYKRGMNMGGASGFRRLASPSRERQVMRPREEFAPNPEADRGRGLPVLYTTTAGQRHGQQRVRI